MKKKLYDLDYLKKHKQYSNKEVADLFISFYSGDMDARKKLIVGHLYIINIVINKTVFDLSEVSCEDLFSIGEIGLMNAVDSYDISSNVLFSTYAYTCIRNEIVDYLRRKYNYETLTLENDYEYEYTHSIGYRSSNFLEFIEEEDYIDDVVDDRDLLNKLYLAINSLDENSRKAVMLHYGFSNFDEHTVREVAKLMNITYGEARGMINRSRLQIRRYLESEGYNSANTTNISKYCKKYF